MLVQLNLMNSPLSGFPGGSDGKESACNVGNLGSIPGLGRSPGEGNVNLAIFLPGKSHAERSLAGYSAWGHKESDITKQLTHNNTTPIDGHLDCVSVI